ncbi:hypothetical protein [Marinoscillum sp. 108]|uniref:hypothetical protein n=1 Tax=Marinoscillum sp. 108 TaxID=2653151 RepID=UPI0012F45293|nr:hypothetical protein [Marinoscillum sp. 108]VXD13400.1 conserved hypothetical protein [Marinoscillum sp. 108]
MFAKHIDFYRGFQSKFFLNKQKLNENNFNSVSSQTDSEEPKELLNTIRIDSRITYLTSIETLFQLIIALKPSDKYNADERVLINLSKKSFYYKDIRDFSSEKESLFDFLLETYKARNGQLYLKAKHIFYFNLAPESYDELSFIDKSLNSIIDILRTLAADLSDRREYNAYKHGMRIFPVWTKFGIATKDMKNKVEFDLNDSFTLMEYDFETNKTTSITIKSDLKRDFLMTELVTALIDSIIGTRKKYFSKDNSGIYLNDFGQIDISEYSKPNVTSHFMEFSMQPEHSKTKSNKR